MLRKIAKLLILAMLIAVFSACASDGGDTGPTGDIPDAFIIDDENGGTGTETEEADPYDPGLPPTDFGGYEFRILNFDQDSMWWSIVDIDAEELTGEPVHDAMYQRSRNMEDKYNFTLSETQVSGGRVTDILRLSAAAGTDEYDIAFADTRAFPTLVSHNAIINLRTVPNLNLDAPWWNPGTQQYFTMEGTLFTMTSDLTLTPAENMVILMYNTSLAETLGLSSSQELYALVDAGQWTFDSFYRLNRAAAADLSGTGVVDGDQDRFGVTLVSWFYQAMMVGFGETITRMDELNLPVIAANTDRFMRAWETMVEFMAQRDLVVREFTDSSRNTEYVFVEDRALFCAQVLSVVRLYRHMDSDFALLPLPKLDGNQAQYHTPTWWSTAVVIPAATPNIERTGHILEALTAESRRLVRPAYFDVAIGMQYLRDEDSFRMLDLMQSTQTYDIALTIYDWGSFGGAFNSTAQAGNTNFTSLMERFEGRIITGIERTLDVFRNTH
jgi:hypothetical protein